MLKSIWVVVLVLLATSESGCAIARRNQPHASSILTFDDHYSLKPIGGAQDAASQDTDRWWTLFEDPLLADFVSRTDRDPAKADIAKAYIGLRVQQARIADARSYLAAQEETRKIAHFRSEAKLVTERDALQIDAETARVVARIPSLQAAVEAGAARIAVIAGGAPGSFRESLASPAPIPTGPDTVAVGRPSDLLERRADLRKATARLRATGWLPGNTRAALTSYRQAVQRAEEDAEDGLAAFNGARAREQALVDAVAKAERVARLARQQYHDGLANYDAVSGAEKALLDVSDALAEARGDRARALINLCLALGGGHFGKAAGK